MPRRSEISLRNEKEPRFARERRRLGLRLRQLRDQRMLTQEQAAEKIGVHPIHLGRIEGGQENVTLATIIAISEAYRMPIRSFFEQEPAPLSDLHSDTPAGPRSKQKNSRSSTR